MGSFPINKNISECFITCCFLDTALFKYFLVKEEGKLSLTSLMFLYNVQEQITTFTSEMSWN